MEEAQITQHVTLTPNDHQRVAIVCGQMDENIHLIERHLSVEINNRGNRFQIIGLPKSIAQAEAVLLQLYNKSLEQSYLNDDTIMTAIQAAKPTSEVSHHVSLDDTYATVGNTRVKPRTPNQRHYIRAIKMHDINFGIGPSGTGKTFLAVACALEALDSNKVNRIVLCRPAVEAGENLGFLPGDINEKIAPYLQPLYDALFSIAGIEKINNWIEKGVLEVAPLAYMRGRTLSDSFVILDEGQNTTTQQMKMFLTRIGLGSSAVITGDITQTDLPRQTESGLRHAIELLQDIQGIHFNFFKSNDIVRHPLIQKIIEAYEQKGS